MSVKQKLSNMLETVLTFKLCTLSVCHILYCTITSSSVHSKSHHHLALYLVFISYNIYSKQDGGATCNVHVT